MSGLPDILPQLPIIHYPLRAYLLSKPVSGMAFSFQTCTICRTKAVKYTCPHCGFETCASCWARLDDTVKSFFAVKPAVSESTLPDYSFACKCCISLFCLSNPHLFIC